VHGYGTDSACASDALHVLIECEGVWPKKVLMSNGILDLQRIWDADRREFNALKIEIADHLGLCDEVVEIVIGWYAYRNVRLRLDGSRATHAT
jgi:hypothetical protein